MVEFLLQRPEILAVLDAIHVNNIVGISHDTLFPADAQQRRAIIEEGIAQLQAHHLLVLLEGETPILDRDLFATVSVVAFPDIAVMIVRNVEGAGPQLFLEYVSGDLVAEQTFPEEGVHRLALLGDVGTLIPRISMIIPRPASGAESAPHVQLRVSQDAFFAADRLIEEGRRDQAHALLAREVPEASALAELMSALEHPKFRGNVAMLRCRDGEIVDARNAAIVQDEHVAWFIAQQTPGETRLTINTTTASQIATRLSQWRDELSKIG